MWELIYFRAGSLVPAFHLEISRREFNNILSFFNNLYKVTTLFGRKNEYRFLVHTGQTFTLTIFVLSPFMHIFHRIISSAPTG